MATVRTLKRLRDEHVPTQLILVDDGEERAELERLVVDQAVESDVVFLGARSDILLLLTAGDAFLLSSISEGIPLSLIEAMGAGISSSEESVRRVWAHRAGVDSRRAVRDVQPAYQVVHETDHSATAFRKDARCSLPGPSRLLAFRGLFPKNVPIVSDLH